MSDHIVYDKQGDARTFVGRGAVDIFAAAVVASGLRLYAKTGMRPNRAYTPTNMMKFARHWLGPERSQGLKARDYLEAAERLSQLVQELKAKMPAVVE